MQKYGRTALAWAALKGHGEVVDMLLKAGANLHIQDTVMHGYSMQSGHV